MDLLQRCSHRPVTTFVIASIVSLHVAILAASQGLQRETRALQRQAGLVQRLNWVTEVDGQKEVWQPDLYGPFDLWDGDWWRIPLSTLHHADVLHLALNGVFLAIFGSMLERLWGSWRYGLFLLAAAFIVPLPEYWWDQEPLGISGVACAVFGALCSLRASHPGLREQLSVEQIFAVLAGLMFCVLLTELELVPIANLSHFTGLAYGLLAGWLAGLPPDMARVRWPLFLAAHGLLIWPYYLVLQPEMNGRYHWYRATFRLANARGQEFDESAMRQAVHHSPELAAAWLMLVQHHDRHGRQLQAWETALRGLSYNPGNPELWDASRRLWRRLAVSPERKAAVESLHATFPDNSEVWWSEIRKLRPPPVLIAPDRPTPRTQHAEMVGPRAQWSAGPFPLWRNHPTDALPHPDPQAEDSAAEGRLM